MRKKNPEKIAVRMPNWLGDFVMASYALREIKRKNPKALLHVYCKKSFLSLSLSKDCYDVMIPLKRKMSWSQIRHFRQQKYDIGYVFTNSFSSYLIFFLGGIKTIIGRRNFISRLLATTSIPIPKGLHHVKIYQTIAGIESISLLPTLRVPFEKKSKREYLIGIHPGASYGSAKCWPVESFRRWISLVLEISPLVNIVCVGTDIALMEEVCRGFDENRVVMKRGTSLLELCRVIQSCDIFVTNDSGPMHIAANLGVYLIALFGSTSQRSTGPFPKGVVIHKNVPCSPCFFRTCPIDFPCMKMITPEEVRDKVLEQFVEKYRKELAEIHPVMPAVKRQGKPLVVILAAGKGTRLGQKGPKGKIVVHGKTLFDHILEKIPVDIPTIIVTSTENHQETVSLCRGKKEHLFFFPTRMLPAYSEKGVFTSQKFPEGNGAFMDAIDAFGSLEGISWIQVVPIDNYLAPVLDERLFDDEADLVVLGVKRKSSKEQMGLLQEKKALSVKEYLYSSEEERQTDDLGFTGVFSFRASCWEELRLQKIPYHEIQKQGLIHIERFAMDLFPCFPRYKVVEMPREECFYPIKTEGDLEQLSPFAYNSTK